MTQYYVAFINENKWFYINSNDEIVGPFDTEFDADVSIDNEISDMVWNQTE